MATRSRRSAANCGRPPLHTPSALQEFHVILERSLKVAGQVWPTRGGGPPLEVLADRRIRIARRRPKVNELVALVHQKYEGILGQGEGFAVFRQQLLRPVP